MGKNLYRKYEKQKRKIIWIVIGIIALLIIAIVTINIPDRKVNFFSTLIFESLFVSVALISGLYLFKTSLKNKLGIGNRIFHIFLALNFIIVLSFMAYSCSKEYQDIPYIIASKYESKVGILTGSSSHSRHGTEFEIDGIRFYFDRKIGDSLVMGKRYKVEYLPHSKYVMNVYK